MSAIKQSLKAYLDKAWQVTDKLGYEVLADKVTYPFANQSPSFTDAAITDSYTADNRNSPHFEYVKRLRKNVVIEPDYGYCITGWNKIAGAGVYFPKLKPSFPRYIAARLKGNVEHIGKAILFDGRLGNNYFHFFSDVLSKLWLLDQFPELKTYPLVIGHKVYDTRYFQYLLNNTELKNRNWLVLKPGQYLQATEIVFIRPAQYSKTYFLRTKALLNLRDNPAENRRVFLNRNIKSGRYISNLDEIIPVLAKYNFEIIETEGMPFDKQAELFNSIKHLISIHGAGGINIIFSKPGLRFLEISPTNRIACQFYWVAKALGVEYYDAILGGALPQTHTYPEKGFHVDASKLEAAIQRLLTA